MKIDYNSLPAHRATVARDAAIVARYKARRIPTTDGAVRTTDPVHSQLAWKSKQQRGKFRDSHTRDVWITAEGPNSKHIATPKNENMMGRTWQGDLTSELDALSAADRQTALDAMRKVLDDYGQSLERGTMRPDNFGSLSTVGDERPEQVFNVGPTATPDDINAANAAAVKDGVWKPRATLDVTPRNAEQAQLQIINSENAAFWAKQTAHQASPRREWGRG
jgi:hypothetical protein